jgi:hypothetical protein
MKIAPISILVAGFAFFALAGAHAQEARCLPAGSAVAEARTGAIVMAQHDGSAAAAIRVVMEDFVTNNDVPAADEISVLYSKTEKTVLLIGSTEGCLRWRGVFPLTTYEEVVRKALGPAI